MINKQLTQLICHFFVIVAGCSRVDKVSSNYIKINYNLFSKLDGLMEVVLLFVFMKTLSKAIAYYNTYILHFDSQKWLYFTCISNLINITHYMY